MINFPIFESLDIDGYGLFPGTGPSLPGLHVTFHPGLTLILGANGLGKTTLITAMFRMLTGPFDIPGLAGPTPLGTTNLTPSFLPYSSRAMFAQRVVDGARNAVARIRFRLGEQLVTLDRRLNDLQLVAFSIGNETFPVDEKSSFQVEIPRLAGVWSFGDWILLLRHLV
ncbi:MAG: AAA family ATPase, partial [Chloroflexota bacterium]